MKDVPTPLGQRLDKVTNKIFKFFLCEVYDVWELTSRVNTITGAPLSPTFQQVASWVVQAWDRITEELYANSWTACEYKTKK